MVLMVKSIHVLDILRLDPLRHILTNAWEYLLGSVHLDPHGAFWEGWGRGQAHRRSPEVYWSLSHPIICLSNTQARKSTHHISLYIPDLVSVRPC